MVSRHLLILLALSITLGSYQTVPAQQSGQSQEDLLQQRKKQQRRQPPAQQPSHPQPRVQPPPA